MRFSDVVRKRKSVRSFGKKDVPDTIIEEVIEAGTFAPTSCNQQRWQFVVVKDAKTKQRLVDEAASSTLVGRAPVVIIVSYDCWSRKEAIQAGAMAVQNMLLAATELGLGVLAMNSYGADEQVKRVVGLPENQLICCFVLLGYPDKRAKDAPLVPRRAVKEVVHHERFSGNVMPRLFYDPDKWTAQDLIDHQRHYCRKTFLGKEMDIMHESERQLVAKELAGLKGDVLDLFSYDGAYLREFPALSLTTADLCAETAAYSKAAARLTVKEPSRVKDSVIDGTKVAGAKEASFDAATVLFKMERLPKDMQADALALAHRHVKKDGEIVIVARRDSLAMSLFLWSIRSFFGDDVRKTGIYAFFGGYKPLRVGGTKRLLRTAGWSSVTSRSYFWIPAFFDQVLQMALQYRASAGSSYLHRVRRETLATKMLSLVLRLQGSMRCPFGSVVVIRARKR